MTTPTAATPRRVELGLVVLLGCLAMIGPFTIDTIFPGFTDLSAEFTMSEPEMQHVISIYLVTLAVMSLWHGPLSDALGRKRVLVVGCCGYALASIGCALAPTYGALLGFRAVQGLFAGVGLIVGRAVIRDLLEASAAQRLLSQVTMVFGIAPAVAPIVGGWLIGWGWRSIFWFLAALGGALALAAAVALRETHPRSARTTFSVGAVAGGVGRCLRDGPTARLAVAAGMSFGAMFLYIASAPAFVQGLLRRDEQDYWMMFVPLIGGMVLGSYAGGRLAGRMRPARTASLGLGICILGGLFNVSYAAMADPLDLPWAVVGPSLGAVGIGISFPIFVLSILDRSPHARGAAASVQSFTQLILQAAMTSLLSPHISDSGAALALAALAMTVTASALWCWHVIDSRRSPAAPAHPAALIPLD